VLAGSPTWYCAAEEAFFTAGFVTAVESSGDLLAANGWKREREKAIFRNDMAAVSADSERVGVSILPTNSSRNRSIAFEVRIDFPWFLGNLASVLGHLHPTKKAGAWASR